MLLFVVLIEFQGVSLDNKFNPCHDHHMSSYSNYCPGTKKEKVHQKYRDLAPLYQIIDNEKVEIDIRKEKPLDRDISAFEKAEIRQGSYYTTYIRSETLKFDDKFKPKIEITQDKFGEDIEIGPEIGPLNAKFNEEVQLGFAENEEATE